MKLKRYWSAALFCLLSPVVHSEEKQRDLSHHSGGGYGHDIHSGGYGHDDHKRGYGHDDHKGGYGHDDHKGGYGHDDHKRGYGHEEHKGGYGHDDHKGGGGYGHDDHKGGYGHDDHKGGYDHHGGGGGYKPHPPKKCHPQTITKYKTIYKDRKANVVNQVEVLNPRPHIKKVTETRYTTIRYPVFITQVIKPLLTQVETKVKPIFFTKTIDKYTTVLFTVTGIGQVTVTSVKYEKEYITRCKKKGGYHRGYGSEEGPLLRAGEIDISLTNNQAMSKPTAVAPPPGVPYVEIYEGPVAKFERFSPYPSIPPFRNRRRNVVPRKIPRPPIPSRSRVRKGRPAYEDKFEGRIGDVEDLYVGDIYYRTGRSGNILEASAVIEIPEEEETIAHPPLINVPAEIVV